MGNWIVKGSITRFALVKDWFLRHHLPPKRRMS